MIRTIVVGGGVIGAAVFYELSRLRGVEVTLLERSQAGARGATSISGGIVRCLHDDAQSVERALYGLDYFRSFGQLTGQALPFVNSGCLYLISEARRQEAEHAVTRWEGRLPLRWIDRHAAQTMFPGIDWTRHAGALFEPMAGYASPLSAARCFVAAAVKNGGDYRAGATCEKVVVQESQVTGVEISGAYLPADVVVMAAGAWSRQLAIRSAIVPPAPLATKAIQMTRYAGVAGKDVLPPFLDDESGLYGRGDSVGQLLIGGAVETWDINPDDPQIVVPADFFSMREKARTTFKTVAESAPFEHLRMFDSYTRDRQPILGPSQDVEGLLWATGFSGGGFKFCPYAARRIARIVEEQYV